MFDSSTVVSLPTPKACTYTKATTMSLGDADLEICELCKRFLQLFVAQEAFAYFVL